MPPSLSVVIPVYRGEKSLPPLIQALATVLPTLSPQYEVVLVEDNGGDHSWQVIQELHQQFPWVRGIKFMRNYGQHSALLCGIRHAQHEVIITMDDDLQHPPAEIPKLLATLQEGYEVVYGAPQEKKHNAGRNLGSFLIRFSLSRAMGVSAARRASPFRAFYTYLRRAFEGYNSPYVAIDVLLTWGTKNFGVVEVEHHPRTLGTSGYNFGKLVAHAMTMLTGFSALPLRLASWLGFGLTGFGLLLFLYVVPIRLWILGYHAVEGFTFLASMIAIFSGAQMFTIGIIGEYLARMHFRLMDKPPYTVLYDTTPPADKERV